MEKVLIECCLEIFAADLVVGIQDLGAAGLSCSTTELAAAGTGGMDVQLDLAPLRDSTLAPEEDPHGGVAGADDGGGQPAKVEAFFAVCDKWDVTATVLGEVTDTGRLRMSWHGEIIVDVAAADPGARGPGLRPAVRAAGLAGRAAGRRADRRARSSARRRRGAARDRCCGWSARPNLADKTWAVEQYDHRVQRQHRPGARRGLRDGAAGLRAAGHLVGIALSTDGNGRLRQARPVSRARSWRWPRPTATWPPPAPSRWPSPTA